MASVLDGGLGNKAGTDRSPGVAPDGASERPTAARALVQAYPDETRTGISSRIDATTPFPDGGWTAQ